jgi:beta-mannosidase
MDLDGTWELHPVAEFSSLWWSEEVPDEGWVQQQMPGQWQELEVFSRYTGKMVYRRTFSFVPEKDRIYRLAIGGVFYKYRAYLNGYALGGKEGYFCPATFNITPYLRAENQLLLEVESPGKNGDGTTPSVLTGVFASHPNFPKGYNPGGIWRPVSILSSGAAYIERWHLRTEELAGDEAVLKLQTEVYAAQAREIMVQLQFNPVNFDGQSFQQEFILKLDKGSNLLEKSFRLQGIRPWQTWDRGHPHLYQTTLSLKVADQIWDERECRFGLRTFTFDNLIPCLNGKRLLVKGSNYLPAALYQSKIGPENYQAEIALLQKTHQNMVRCYQYIENIEFYQAMDEAGILVWQDFPLPTEYSITDLTGVGQQVEEMFKLLGNHPSVVIWALSNRSGYEQEQSRLPGVEFRQQMKKLAQHLGELDPGRPVIPLSGWRTGQMGADTGFNLQYPMEIFKFNRYRRGFKQRYIRFVSWFGRVALGPAEPDAEARALSQRQQAETLRFYIDRLRYHKYKPTGGMLFFCFRALTPGLFWSVVDGQGEPKDSFAALVLCYRPLYVFALLPQEKYGIGTLFQTPICFSNDRTQAAEGAVLVKARLTDPRGQLVWKEQWELKPKPDEETRILGEVSVMLMVKGTYRLNLSWVDQGETNENLYQITVE